MYKSGIYIKHYSFVIVLELHNMCTARYSPALTGNKGEIKSLFPPNIYFSNAWFRLSLTLVNHT